MLVSLIDAYWMLPSHVIAWGVKINRESRWQRLREQFIRKMEVRYTHALIAALRRPRLSLALMAFLLVTAFVLPLTGLVRLELFASDFARMFYVNVELPVGTGLEKTLTTTRLWPFSPATASANCLKNREGRKLDVGRGLSGGMAKPRVFRWLPASF